MHGNNRDNFQGTNDRPIRDSELEGPQETCGWGHPLDKNGNCPRCDMIELEIDDYIMEKHNNKQ